MITSERGQGSIGVLAVVLIALLLASIMGAVASLLVVRSELQQSAEVAAVTYVQARESRDDTATKVARANGAEQVRIVRSADGVTISVERPAPRAVRALTPKVSATKFIPVEKLNRSVVFVGTAGSGEGGDYSGPLERVDQVLLCPAVAEDYRSMQQAAGSTGISLVAVSGYRSFDEQAILFAQLGPGIAAPPGTSLHHQATELDLAVGAAGSPVHAWLTTHAGAYGFIQRYSWEPWHWGNVEGC